MFGYDDDDSHDDDEGFYDGDLHDIFLNRIILLFW